MDRRYRKTIVAGNWKMNMTPSEAKKLAVSLLPLNSVRTTSVVLCVPAIDIPAVSKAVKTSHLSVGAQTCHYAESGAFTGETSVSMLRDCNVKYVIVGHSERRRLFNETDTDVNLKALAVLGAGMHPIVCIGETQEQRDAGVTEEVINLQIKLALKDMTAAQIRRIVIAYEPIWAIGTGNTATPEQAEEVCSFIRSVLRGIYGARVARAVSILYGGSMNEKNAASLLKKPDIDGGLIGGASLSAEKFSAIVEASK